MIRDILLLLGLFFIILGLLYLNIFLGIGSLLILFYILLQPHHKFTITYTYKFSDVRVVVKMRISKPKVNYEKVSSIIKETVGKSNDLAMAKEIYDKIEEYLEESKTDGEVDYVIVIKNGKVVKYD